MGRLNPSSTAVGGNQLVRLGLNTLMKSFSLALLEDNLVHNEDFASWYEREAVLLNCNK